MSRAPRRPLTSEECTSLLAEVGWGVVAVAERASDHALPVAVPSSYGFDGEHLYLTMTEGRKRRALARNARLCLTVSDVRSLHQWRSVMVIGEPKWIRAAAPRRAAIAAIREQARRSGWPLTAADAARFANADLLRLEISEMHGFASGPSAVAHDAADPPSAAMNFLRRVVLSLRAERARSEAVAGATSAQVFVLREIHKAKSIGVGELAQRTATAQSSVSEVVARLVERGLVRRGVSRTDHRRAELTLTAAGRARLAGARETVAEGLLSAFRRLPALTRRDTADGLARWIAEAGLAGGDAPMFFEPGEERTR